MSSYLQIIQRLQNELAIANAKMHQLQQENASLRKQISSELTPTTNSSLPSESTPPSSKCPRSPNNDAAPPTTKVSKLPNPKPKHSLAAIARQFSSPTAPSSFTFIRVPIRRCLPIHQLGANLLELHINTHRILDIQYSDRNVVSFLIHTGFEPELRLQLYKHKSLFVTTLTL
ncbi:hypothetical protein G6F49_004676 [Rhizopus delemar]|nr:hypothetical protein G6F49_004676 [Rhizopus delemar]KAG1632782.1 hypothetical protein G6F44_010618 [Rhizopus delemar]